MSIRIVFRNMDPSPVMEQLAREKLKKIEDFLVNEPTPHFIDLVLQPSKTREHHEVKLIIKTPNYELVSEHDHPHLPFYEVMDDIIDRMYFQLHEKDKKRIDDRKMVGRHEEFKKQR